MKYFLLFLALLFSFFSFSQDPKANKILTSLANKVEESSTSYYEFSTSSKNVSSKTNETLSGKSWVKGNKYHTVQGKTTTLSNGIKTWTILGDEKTVYIDDEETDDNQFRHPLYLMTFWKTGYKSKYDKESKLSGEIVHEIVLTPTSRTSAYAVITLSISNSGNDLKKITFRQKNGTITSILILKTQYNITIDNSKFVFDSKKYPGYQIVKD